MANVGRSVICVGSGNNGNDRIHTAGRLQQGQSEIVEMSIGAYETTLNLQLWKAYADEIEIFLETPSGENLPVLSERIGTQRYRAGETELLVLCNLREREIAKPLPVGWTDAEKLLGNYPDTADTLRPYECVVLKK